MDLIGDYRGQVEVSHREREQRRRAAVQKVLNEAVVEAQEEGYGKPSGAAIESALKVSSALPDSVLGDHPNLSATSEEVSLHLHGRKNHSVLLLFESSGRVRCLVNLNGVHRRAIYDSDETLPDGFVREALGDVHGTPTWWW